jgi:hypothetical protein
MATKIVTKNSSTASAVPTASDLVQGELAVNVADKRLFTEDNTGTIVELGTNPSTIDINAGSIDGTAIGASSASTGAFTTLTATGLTVDTNTLYVDSTNNRVGIGTTSPDTLMHLSANTGATLTLESTDTAIATNEAIGTIDFFSNDASGIGAASRGSISLIAQDAAGAGSMLFKTSNASSASTERMRIDSSGNVGIGTTSPSTKLHVNTGSAGYGLTLAASSQTSGTYQLGIDSSSNLAIFDTAASSQRFVISNQGNVGIGTSSPSDTLSVVNLGSSGTGVQISSGTSSGDLRFKARTESYNGIVSVYDSGSNEDVRISAHSGIDTYFNSGSNVGIGTSLPVSKLDAVLGSTSRILLRERSSRAYIDSVTETNSAFDSLGINGSEILFETNGSERARIDSSGNILFGKTAASTAGQGIYIEPSGIGYGRANFVSQSTTGIPLAFYYDNGSTPVNVGRVQTSATTTSYITSSDQRLKENIADADDAGSKIDAIQVRQFDWKADGSHQDYGMIAQELQAVAPEAVSGDADSEEMMGVDYSKLVPMLIKEIQSLRNRVAQLEE